METPKHTLKRLERAPVGKRFQTLYRKRQESRHGGLKNVLFIVGGVLTVAAGVVTYPIPVIPSDVLILLGIALFAQGSRRGAIILDAIERWLREHVPAAFRLWRRLSRTGKIAVTVAWMALVSIVSYGVYVLLSD